MSQPVLSFLRRSQDEILRARMCKNYLEHFLMTCRCFQGRDNGCCWNDPLRECVKKAAGEIIVKLFSTIIRQRKKRFIKRCTLWNKCERSESGVQEHKLLPIIRESVFYFHAQRRARRVFSKKKRDYFWSYRYFLGVVYGAPRVTHFESPVTQRAESCNFSPEIKTPTRTHSLAPTA